MRIINLKCCGLQEEDEQMTKIKRQFEYFSFFQNFNNPGSAPKMRSNASPMVRNFSSLGETTFFTLKLCIGIRDQNDGNSLLGQLLQID